MKKNKALALLLAIALLLSFAAGCGNQSSDDPDDSSADAEAPASNNDDNQEAAGGEDSIYPLVEETTDLSFFFQADAGSLSVNAWDDNTTYKAVEELTNVHIVFMPVHTEMITDQFSIQINAGTMADLICDVTEGYSYGADYGVDQGLFVDLEQYKEFCPNYIGMINSNENYKKDVYTDSGYLPLFYRLTDKERLSNNLVVRQDMMDALNLETPVTYDDYHEVLTALHTEYGATLALYSDAAKVFGDGFNALMSYFPGIRPFYQVDGVVKYGYLEPEFKEYITMISQWYSEGLINETYIYKMYYTLIFDNDYIDEVTTGNVGVFVTYPDQLTMIPALQDDPNFTLAPVPTPVRKEGDIISVCSQQVANGTSYNFSQPVAINADCENIELAVQWMDFWYSDLGKDYAAHGIEGDTYTIVDGEFKFTDIIAANPDGLSAQSAPKVYGGYQIPSYIPASVLDPTLNEKQINCYEVWASNRNFDRVIPGSVSMTGDENAEISNIMTDIDTYASENILAFVVGQKPMSEFDAFVEKLYDLGIEEAIAVKQQAYDRYLSR